MNRLYLSFMQGDTLLGFVFPYDGDFPWVYCHFLPTPAFEPLRSLFQAESDALDARLKLEEEKPEDKDTAEKIRAEWEQACVSILTLNLRLINKNGKAYPIRGEEDAGLPPVLRIQGYQLFYR